MKYKCLECGYVFERPKTISEDRTPGGAFEGFNFLYKVCPNCNGEYEEAVICDGCFRYFYDKTKIYFRDKILCEKCYAKISHF